MLVLVNVLSMPLIRVGYELNKEYIVKNLCENREKPQLQCEGKCHLAKSVKAASQDTQQNGLNLKAKSLSYEFLDATLTLPTPSPQATTVPSYGLLLVGSYSHYAVSILHPPQV